MNRWHSGQSRKFSRGEIPGRLMAECRHHGRTYLDENGRCEMCVLEREAAADGLVQWNEKTEENEDDNGTG